MKTKIPRVTEVIKAAGIGPDFSFVNEEQLSLKSRLGTDVHRLCASWPRFGRKGKLPDSPAMDYARQFRAWIQKTGATIQRDEYTITGRINGLPYIGHPDLKVYWKGTWILDIKTTSQVHPSHGVQLAAYTLAEKSCFGGIHLIRRAVLWLSPTSARLIEFKQKDDYEAWKACLTLFYWRRNHEQRGNCDR